MKNLKILFGIFILVLLLISCKDDDETSCRTFLECHDGTTWVNFDFGEEVYIRINNNINNPWDRWSYDSFDECYEFFHSYQNFDDIEIIENSEDRFIFRVIDGNNTYDLTLTVQGEILKIVELYENESNISYLDKSTENVDDLVLCD